MRTVQIEPAVSNTDFARRVGIHYTMASRIRNGKRMPSAATLTAIIRAFHISEPLLTSMMNALDGGQDEFGKWIRKNLFVPTAD